MNLSNLRRVQIKKRTATRWIALVILFLPFVFSCLTELLKLPGVIRFSADLLIIISVIIVSFNAILNRRYFVSRVTSVLGILVSVFFLYTLVAYLFNYQSAFYYIWGFRNNFRFFAAFFLFISFFELEDIEDIFKAFDVLFWIHFVVILVQFFVFRYEQDFLGGIFGTQKGCNGYVVVFLTIVITRSMLSFMNEKEKMYLCFLKSAAALLVAALAELKIFFFIFIVVLLLSSMITSFSAKKAALMLGGALLIIIAYTLLVALFEYFDNFLSVDFLINTLFQSNYASDEDMGRFTSIAYICNRFLTTVPERLFGMGLVKCDVSSIAIFNTSFYDMYVDTHYSVLSIAFMFIETGFIGLIMYLSFFAICLGYSIFWFKKRMGNRFFNQMGIVISVLCFVLVFYNSSLRLEAGYMVYFVLALPFIGVASEEQRLLK